MRYSYNTTHTFEACSFSPTASEASPKLGQSVIVCPSNCLQSNLCEYADQLFSHYLFPLESKLGTKVFSKNALASRARMAVEAIKIKLKPTGTIADVGLTPAQSNREVTKTNVTKTPYPDAQSIRANRRVVAKINLRTQTSNRMRCTTS